MTFTTLNTVEGTTGARMGEVKNMPFGWKTSSTYTIRIITDNGFTTEGSYTTPSAFA